MLNAACSLIRRTVRTWLLPTVVIGLIVHSDARGAAAPDPEKASTAYADLQPPVTRPSAPETVPPPPPPQAVRHLEAGGKLHDEQRYTEAILELEKALRYDPNNHRVHILLALACQQSGNEGRATAHVERALKANPDDVTGHYLLGLGAGLTKSSSSGAWGATRGSSLSTTPTTR